MQRVTMRALHLMIAAGCCWPLAAAAALQGHDMVAEGNPLLHELGNPKYEVSRCLLAPVLAADGRTVVKSPDAAFMPEDTFIAVDGEVLDDHSRTALIDILERRPPGAEVKARVSREGTERVVAARCTDSKPYYAALREAARAAAAGDAAACAQRSDSAARLHGPSSIWLRLSMSCKIEAGRLSGDPMWRADYELFRQRIAEARPDAPLLKSLRHPVQSAARDLAEHGYPRLADALRRDYAAAFATLGVAAHDED